MTCLDLSWQGWTARWSGGPSTSWRPSLPTAEEAQACTAHLPPHSTPGCWASSVWQKALVSHHVCVHFRVMEMQGLLSLRHANGKTNACRFFSRLAQSYCPETARLGRRNVRSAGWAGEPGHRSDSLHTACCLSLLVLWRCVCKRSEPEERYWLEVLCLTCVCRCCSILLNKHWD